MSEKAKFSALIPFLGALTALGPLSNDLYVPSLTLVADSLNASGSSVQLTMSSLLLGFALGCLIYGPLADRYGRKPVLCFGLAVYVVGAFSSSTSGDLTTLVAFRFLQGMGASAGMVLSRVIILDRWTGEQASRAMSWVSMFMFLTPVIAPLIGGYIASFGAWQTVFLSQAGVGLLCLAVTLTMLPRMRRTEAIGLLESFRAYGIIVTDRMTLGYLACVGLTFVGVIAFVSNSSFVFIEYYGLEPYQYGFCFSLVMLGGSIGSYANSHVVERMGLSRMIGIGTLLLAGSGLTALIAGWMEAGLLMILLPTMVYVFGIGFIWANSMASILSRFRRHAGAASAVFGMNQFLIGAVVAAGLSALPEPTPLPLVTALAASGIGSAAIWWGWLKRAA